MSFLNMIHRTKHDYRECHAWSEFIGFVQSLQRRQLWFVWQKNGNTYNIVYQVK